MLLKFIKDNFGSKKGFYNAIKFKLLFSLGFYNKYKKIDFSKVDNLVFICSGNICRSSLGEYVAKSLNISSESFGLHCRGGDPADPRAIDFGRKYNLDISKHITRNIKDYSAKESDLIIAMEPSHIKELEEHGFANFQITTVPIWSMNNIYLHDPFSTNMSFFNKCEENVLHGVKNIVKKLSIK